MAAMAFRGVIPPVPTIWTSEGKLDRAGMGRLIDFLIDGGVDVLFFGGSAGEFSQMTPEMRREVAEFGVTYTAKRKPVVVGIASLSTEETIRLGEHAREIGADGVVIVNPYYAILLPDNIYLHYKRVAEAVTLPIILYNFPALTGQDLSPALIKRLAMEFPNIVGVKDTTDTIRHIRDVILAVKPVRPDFAVLAGFDEYLLDTMIMGGDGGFPSSASFAPWLARDLLKAIEARDGAAIIDLQRRISIAPAMFGLESPFYAIVKEAINAVGVAVSTHVLPPAVPLTEEKKAKVREYLRMMDVKTV